MQTVQVKAYLTKRQIELHQEWTRTLRKLYNVGLGLLFESQQQRWIQKNDFENLSVPGWEFSPLAPVKMSWVRENPSEKNSEFRLASSVGYWVKETKTNPESVVYAPNIREYSCLTEPEKLVRNKIYTNKYILDCHFFDNTTKELLLKIPMKLRQSFVKGVLLESWQKYLQGHTKKLKFKPMQEKIKSLHQLQTSEIKLYLHTNECRPFGVEFGKIKFRGIHNRHKEELQPRTISLSKRADGYYLNMVFRTEEKESVEPVNTPKIVGLDPGVRTFLTLSDGTEIPNPRYLQQSEKRLAELQQKRSSLTPKSQNYQDLNIAIARLHKKIADRRKNYAHKISTYLLQKYDIIYIEDTQLTNMVRRPKAKPNQDEAGPQYLPNGASRKAGLNKAILDSGIGLFRELLEKKASTQKSKSITRVPAKNSSITCSQCGAIDSNSRNDKEFHCTTCGYICDADLNAAKILEQRGRLGNISKKKKKTKTHKTLNWDYLR